MREACVEPQLLRVPRTGGPAPIGEDILRPMPTELDKDIHRITDAVTAPGQMFELTEVTRRGVQMPAAYTSPIRRGADTATPAQWTVPAALLEGGCGLLARAK